MNKLIKAYKESEGEFEKYKKDYIIDSEPKDYIHVGPDSSFQFSELVDHNRKSIIAILRSFEGEIKEVEKQALNSGQHDLKGRCDFERVTTCRIFLTTIKETIEFLEK